MNHDTRQFVREAKSDIRDLIEQCDHCEQCEAGHRDPAEQFDREVEVIVRSTIGGSANLGFFIPYLWKHRH